MSKTFYQEMELAIKARIPGQIETLLYYYGIPLNLYMQKQNKESAVYGTAAGSIESTPTEIIGILVSNDFIDSDSGYAGDFSMGFLYTKEKISKGVGAYVEIANNDLVKRFKIDKLKSIGTTTEIFFRYEVLAVAD